MSATALAIAALVATPGPAGALPTASVRLGAVPRLPAGARVVGALAATAVLDATVTLQPRDPAALASYARAVSTPGSRAYRHFLTTAQFAATFAPAPAQVAAVRATLSAHGLTAAPASANGLSIKISGSAFAFARTFDTAFIEVRAADGRLAHANTRAPLIRGPVAALVQGVVGLDDLVAYHHAGSSTPTLAPTSAATSAATSAPTAAPHVVTGGPQPCSAARHAGRDQSGYTADQIASAYDFSPLYRAGDLGAGQTIAMYELEPNLVSDIAAFQSCYGTHASITYKKVGRGSGTGAGTGEAALDIEDAIGIAPAAAQLVYQGRNSGSGPLDTYTAIVSDNLATIISTSWGLCEGQQSAATAAAENTLFQEAATQGQSVFDASGDRGSADCDFGELATDDPAGQPFVTVVGGTTITHLATPPTEVVWNNSTGASGGGISEYFSMPWYQSQAASNLHVVDADSTGTPCSAKSGSSCRQEPDVALDADPLTGYVVYADGSWTVIGGTSAAAPAWAAYTALVNASAGCAGTRVGFANPALYQLAGESYATYFNDVVSGNNDYFATTGKYEAGPGYDLASGLGTPKGAALASALCALAAGPPQVNGVSPASGPAAGGTLVTITGSGFTGATSVNFGGVPAARFTVTSDTGIVATTAPQAASTHNIVITTASGKNPLVAADRFTFTRPVITAVSPAAGPSRGGTRVTIRGVGFARVTAVAFGGVRAARFQVVSDTTIVAVSPAQRPSVHNIVVTTAYGTTAPVAADRFTYTRPVITAVSPAAGPSRGGTRVTIRGVGFARVTAVAFGAVRAARFQVVSDTTIVAVSPAQRPSVHNIVVTTAYGTTAPVAADRFTFRR